MIVNSLNITLDLEIEMMDKYRLNEIAYFDIETTGFDKQENNIILISLGFYDSNNNFKIIQYFADTIEDEINILKAFSEDISNFNKWCSYNGKAFDEPFIKNRMKFYGLEENLPEEHVDLYRKIRPYYKNLGLQRCNLKSVEKYAGVERKDKIDGGLSVELYEDYLINQDSKIRDIIMLHNFEDVSSLPVIFKIIYKIDTDDTLIRDNVITEKQLNFLNSLLKRNKIELDVDLTRISKKAASKAINSLLKDKCVDKEIIKMINNSY